MCVMCFSYNSQPFYFINSNASSIIACFDVWNHDKARVINVIVLYVIVLPCLAHGHIHHAIFPADRVLRFDHQIC